MHGVLGIWSTDLYPVYSSSVTLTSVPGGLTWEYQAHFNLQCQLDLDFLTLLKFYSGFYSAKNLLNFKLKLKRGNKLLQSHEIISLFLIFKNCTYCSWNSSSVHSSPTALLK